MNHGQVYSANIHFQHVQIQSKIEKTLENLLKSPRLLFDLNRLDLNWRQSNKDKLSVSNDIVKHRLSEWRLLKHLYLHFLPIAKYWRPSNMQIFNCKTLSRTCFRENWDISATFVTCKFVVGIDSLSFVIQNEFPVSAHIWPLSFPLFKDIELAVNDDLRQEGQVVKVTQFALGFYRISIFKTTSLIFSVPTQAQFFHFIARICFSDCILLPSPSCLSWIMS